MSEREYWNAIATSSMAPEPLRLEQGRREPGSIVVVDYHKGNLSSVARGLNAAGATAYVTDDPTALEVAAGIVLPGVGGFEDAMSQLRRSGQAEALVAACARGIPFLGICLGQQLLFERGNESSDGAWVEGLGILPGDVTRLPSGRLKVPHVGWNQLDYTPQGRTCPLLDGLTGGENFYFTHSFAVQAEESSPWLAARTHYAASFASVVWTGDIFGCQFHPEKSSLAGQVILRNFASIVLRRHLAAQAATVAETPHGVDALLSTLVDGVPAEPPRVSREAPSPEELDEPRYPSDSFSRLWKGVNR